MNDGTETLLVVEDDQFNRSLLVRHLEKEGFTNVETVENGAQALEAARRQDFALILLDIEMPEMDGYEVLEKLKADMRLRDIPVIMISAVEEMDSIVKCIELGAEDYLPKPFNPTLLRARINASLDKKRLTDRQKGYLDQIKSEKNRADNLVRVILPTAAANELKATGGVKPRRYEDVAILFCDLVGFTSFCDRHTPEEVVNGLQALVERFEQIADNCGMEKIKTIGDEFMASAGLLRDNYEPLLSAVRCGLEMGAAAPEINPDWQVRTGVHIGPVVAGIVGHDKYQYDVWGDTVNTAARMTGPGGTGTVTLTIDAWMQVQNSCDGRSLGTVDIKGKGPVEIIECYGLR